MNRFRGQGATEYLVLLAIIIIIALIVVGVMGWFPGVATSITEKESRAYWESAYPLALVEWRITPNESETEFILQNNTVRNISVKEFMIDGNAILINDTNYAPGEKKALDITMGTACQSGGVFSHYIDINYSTQDLTYVLESGDKPLVGYCSG